MTEFNQDEYEIESQAVNTLNQHLESVSKFEKPIREMLISRHSADEVIEAEGKHCIIRIRGLKYHDLLYYIEVSKFGIKIVNPYDEYDTVIVVPINVLNRFLAQILSGDDEALGDAFASGEVKLWGKSSSYHDMKVFEDIFREISRNIRIFAG